MAAVIPFGSALFLFLSAFPAAAQAPLSIQPVRPGVYWAGGGGGANTGIIIGRNEVVVIDAKMTAESARAMLAEIGKLTPNPVKCVVLTHSDGDHVNGLAGFPKGLRIVSHANARGDMEQAFKGANQEALPAWLPNETLAAATKAFDIAGVRIRLLHFGPAHTDGDLVMYLPDHKVAFTGDLIFVGRDPLIHLHKRGTASGLISTLRKLLELDVETYIAGHAAPVSKADIRTLLASLEDKQAKVKALIAQGGTLDEIRKELGAPAPAAGKGGGRPGLIDAIYRDLAGK